MPPAHTLLSVSHGSTYGGAHNQMLRLHGPLLEHGWRTVAVLPDEAGNAAERLAQAGVRVHRLPLGRLRASFSPTAQAQFLRSLPNDVRGLRKVIRELRP